MIREDNNGYVVFPSLQDGYRPFRDKKTFIYIVVFHPNDINNKYVLSNLKLINIEDIYIGDDITGFIGDDRNGGNRYFNSSSITMTGAICIGWLNDTLISTKDNIPWVATFRDLSYEGRKLYYSMKKLHNQKEVRILTFSETFSENLYN